MKNLKNYLSGLFLLVLFISCEQESIGPVEPIADGAGTLTTYKAYTLDSIPGTGFEVYGRAVFWEGIDGNTLLQVSLNNIADTAVHPSSIIAGTTMVPGDVLMPLYDITNTGEGYSFGEFSTSKYYVIANPDFFGSLDTYDAHVSILLNASDTLILSSGNIGLNAEPVESN